MSQRRPIPNMDAPRGWLLVESMAGGSGTLIGARERHNQIQLRAGIDNPADAAQNAIHFSECSKSIDINRLQTGGLRQQFLVAHESPGFLFLSSARPSCVQKWTLRKENLATRTPKKLALGSCSISERIMACTAERQHD